MKIDFLKSTRFWALVVIAIVTVLGNEGIIAPSVVDGLQLILGGHIGIRTIDRFNEK